MLRTQGHRLTVAPLIALALTPLPGWCLMLSPAMFG